MEPVKLETPAPLRPAQKPTRDLAQSVERIVLPPVRVGGFALPLLMHQDLRSAASDAKMPKEIREQLDRVLRSDPRNLVGRNDTAVKAAENALQELRKEPSAAAVMGLIEVLWSMSLNEKPAIHSAVTRLERAIVAFVKGLAEDGYQPNFKGLTLSKNGKVISLNDVRHALTARLRRILALSESAPLRTAAIYAFVFFEIAEFSETNLKVNEILSAQRLRTAPISAEELDAIQFVLGSRTEEQGETPTVIIEEGTTTPAPSTIEPARSIDPEFLFYLADSFVSGGDLVSRERAGRILLGATREKKIDSEPFFESLARFRDSEDSWSEGKKIATLILFERYGFDHPAVRSFAEQLLKEECARKIEAGTKPQENK
jgi:hypothetical protein